MVATRSSKSPGKQRSLALQAKKKRNILEKGKVSPVKRSKPKSRSKRSRKEEGEDEQFKESFTKKRLRNDDFCSICLNGGDLVVCESCPLAFHSDGQCVEHLDRQAVEEMEIFTCSLIHRHCSSRTKALPLSFVERKVKPKNAMVSRTVKNLRFYQSFEFVGCDTILHDTSGVLIDSSFLVAVAEHLDAKQIQGIARLAGGIICQITSLFKDQADFFVQVRPCFSAISISGNKSNHELYVSVDKDDLVIPAQSPGLLQPIKFSTDPMDNLSYILIGAFDPAEFSIVPLLDNLTMNEYSSCSIVKPLERSTVAASNEYDAAFYSLQLSEAPDELPCRDTEFDEIEQFLKTAIKKGGSDSGLYISGRPGTGKTATVRRVIWKLQDTLNAPFDSVEINALKLKSPAFIYSEIWSALNRNKLKVERKSKRSLVAPPKAHANLREYFDSNAKRKKPLVVVVDELDFLVTKKQLEMYNLFHWPSLRSSSLIVIGIANTMDLPERLIPRVRSRMGTRRLVFEPYDIKQLQEILTERLTGLTVFSKDSIELCARRVATLSGDVRRALQICARAVQIVQASERKELVDMNAILKAHSELYNSSSIPMLRTVCLQEKVVLSALYLEYARDVHEVNLDTLRRTNAGLCRKFGIVPVPTYPQLCDLLYSLESVGLIVVERRVINEKGVKYVSKYARLDVFADDVRLVFADDPQVSEIINQ